TRSTRDWSSDVCSSDLHGAGGNHEARERRGKSVLLQEGVERLVLLRAERERGRLMDDARVERWRLEQAGEWLGAPVAGEKVPGRSEERRVGKEGRGWGG